MAKLFEKDSWPDNVSSYCLVAWQLRDAGLVGAGAGMVAVWVARLRLFRHPPSRLTERKETQIKTCNRPNSRRVEEDLDYLPDKYEYCLFEGHWAVVSSERCRHRSGITLVKGEYSE